MLKTGQEVRITCDGRTVDGDVMYASTNGRSLVLRYEAILFGFVGMMPVLQDEKSGEYRALIAGQPVKIEPRDASRL